MNCTCNETEPHEDGWHNHLQRGTKVEPEACGPVSSPSSQLRAAYLFFPSPSCLCTGAMQSDGVQSESVKPKKVKKAERKLKLAQIEATNLTPLQEAENGSTSVLVDYEDVHSMKDKEKKRKRRAEELTQGETDGVESSLPSSTGSMTVETNGDSELADSRSHRREDKKEKRRKLKELNGQQVHDPGDNAKGSSTSSGAARAAIDDTSTRTGDDPATQKRRKKDVPKISKKELSVQDTASLPKATSTSKFSQAETSAFIKENDVTYEPSSASYSFPPILSFEALPVSQGVKNGLKAFQKPTIVQSASWGVQLISDKRTRVRDCVAIASTG